VKVVLLGEIVCQRFIGVVPGAEVVEFAANLLGPYSSGMSEQGKFGVRLGGLARYRL